MFERRRLWYTMATTNIFSLLSVVLMVQVVASISCKEGHFPSDSWSCKKCPPHCVFCESESLCLSCETGYSGVTCEVPCLKCLPGTSCEKTTGFCSDRCKDGLTGILCDDKCDNKCLSCNRTHKQVCLKCAPGRYGLSSCDKYCSGGCTGTCNDSGTCISGCMSGYWGQMCNNSCSKHCTNTLCDRDNGTCLAGCDDNFSGPNCDVAKRGTEIKEWVIILAAIIVVIIVLFAVVFIVCMTLRKQSRKQYNTDEKHPPLDSEMKPLKKSQISSEEVSQNVTKRNSLSLSSVVDDNYFGEEKSGKNIKTSKDDGNKTPETANIEQGIPIANLGQYITNKTDLKKKEELKEINEQIKTRIDNQTYVPGFEKDAYYIDEYEKKQAYIVCRDSMGEKEFWSLVWETKCGKIVYLTDKKVRTFWPSKGETKNYGQITVECVSDSEHKPWVMRCFSTTKECKEEETTGQGRTVSYWHYNNWLGKEHDDLSVLINFRKAVCDVNLEGPLLFRCSDGDGPAATFIALDLLLEHFESKQTVDFVGCLKHLRKQGKSMKLTPEQYEILHGTLLSRCNLSPKKND